MLEWYGPEVYDPLLACAGQLSCPFFINPEWWGWDAEYCGWCPECERSLRVNLRCGGLLSGGSLGHRQRCR